MNIQCINGIPTIVLPPAIAEIRKQTYKEFGWKFKEEKEKNEMKELTKFLETFNKTVEDYLKDRPRTKFSSGDVKQLIIQGRLSGLEAVLGIQGKETADAPQTVNVQ